MDPRYRAASRGIRRRGATATSAATTARQIPTAGYSNPIRSCIHALVLTMHVFRTTRVVGSLIQREPAVRLSPELRISRLTECAMVSGPIVSTATSTEIAQDSRRTCLDVTRKGARTTCALRLANPWDRLAWSSIRLSLSSAILRGPASIAHRMRIA